MSDGYILYLYYFFFQSAWGISVNLVIGPDVGISYRTEKATSVSNFFDSGRAHLG